MAGALASGWHRLGDQSPQVTFTALFALLLGGYQPVHYVTHRMVDVGIGLATGLAVDVLVFPPLQLRPADLAHRRNHQRDRGTPSRPGGPPRQVPPNRAWQLT